MGLAILQEEFEAHDYERFSARLASGLDALELLLARPGFGEYPESLGAELEVSIVDESGEPLPVNCSVQRECADPNLTLELNRFNLEYNLTPVDCAGAPFRALETEIDTALDTLNRICVRHGGRVAAIGILPTLRTVHLEAAAMTDLPRYRALSSAPRRLRGDSFRIEISGRDRLELAADDVTVEGASTSFQVHLRVSPRDFAPMYNAAQIATPIALAVCANSPTLLGHRLWDETRVALFKQAVDARPADDREWRRAARVSFGTGWIRESAHELFAEAVALFPPLLPVVGGEDPLEILHGGGVPRLEELRLHHGTVWRWNRAIFDPADEGHLRIELRALPSGPTPVDMMAGAAFHVGLTRGLRDVIGPQLPGFPFDYAHWNFYRAAQEGLDARLLWPARVAPSPVERSARELALELLPIAEEGLHHLGVDQDESARLLGIIRARLESGVTPATWQRACLERLEVGMSRSEALVAMLAIYLREADTKRPVHEWSDRP